MRNGENQNKTALWYLKTRPNTTQPAETDQVVEFYQ